MKDPVQKNGRNSDHFKIIRGAPQCRLAPSKSIQRQFSASIVPAMGYLSFRIARTK
jgi:hypothetical protein